MKPAALELAAGDGDAIVEAGENVLGERDIEMGEVGPGEVCFSSLRERNDAK